MPDSPILVSPQAVGRAGINGVSGRRKARWAALAGGRRPRAGRGFTLLEILVAVAILGIVLLTAFSSLSAVNRTTTSIEGRLAALAHARACFNRLVADLEALHVTSAHEYRPPGIGDDPDPYRIYCDRTSDDPQDYQRLEFAARAHLPLGGATLPGEDGTLARIAYFVRQAGDRMVLMRSDISDLRAPMVETPPAAVVCDRIGSLHFRLFDGEGEAHDQWDSDDRQWEFATPQAVEIELTLADGAGEMRFHTRVPLRMVREGRS